MSTQNARPAGKSDGHSRGVRSKRIAALLLFSSSIALTANATPSLKWTVDAPSSFSTSAPVLGPKGDIYFTSPTEHDSSHYYVDIYAVDFNGKKKWVFRVPGWQQYRAAPLAIGEDGAVYYASGDPPDGRRPSFPTALYAISATGKALWKIQTADSSTFSNRIVAGPISSRGLIYYGTDHLTVDGRLDTWTLHAIEPTGKERWAVSLPWSNRSNPFPLVAPDGTLFVDYSENIKTKAARAALDPVSGKKMTLNNSIPGQGTVIKQTFDDLSNRVSIHNLSWNGRDLDSDVLIFNPDGSKPWLRTLEPGDLPEAVVHGKDHNIYISFTRNRSTDGIHKSCIVEGVYSIHTMGHINWIFQKKCGNSLIGTPVPGSDGTVYFKAGDSSLYAVDRSGKQKWRLDVSLTAPPTVADDGTVYIVSSRGLSAFKQ